MPDSPHPVYRIPDNANKRKQQRIIIFLLLSRRNFFAVNLAAVNFHDLISLAAVSQM